MNQLAIIIDNESSTVIKWLVAVEDQINKDQAEILIRITAKLCQNIDFKLICMMKGQLKVALLLRYNLLQIFIEMVFYKLT